MPQPAPNHIFVGFGFGPIQAGLFAAEARASGNFDRIVVAEVDPQLVDALRRNGDRYAVNVAGRDGIEVRRVEGVQLLDPRQPDDLEELEHWLSRATEIVTSLPSVTIYAAGGETTSPASLIARALQAGDSTPALIYTAENNNHAAELLEKAVSDACPNKTALRPHAFVNTVIGKMSQVIADATDIADRNLQPIVPGLSKAFLVEEFNAIKVSSANLPDVSPGIEVFESKPDLLPFEEAKLYGHNAIHTMLGFFGRRLGCTSMAELPNHPSAMRMARSAFVDEAGAALRRRHAAVDDPLFSEEGFRAYAEDLLQRMTNPHLNDAVDRIVRDPIRKLGYDDRVFGTMRRCLEQDVPPRNLAVGARAGLRCLISDPAVAGLPDAIVHRNSSTPLDRREIDALLRHLWGDEYDATEAEAVVHLLEDAGQTLERELPSG